MSQQSRERIVRLKDVALARYILGIEEILLLFGGAVLGVAYKLLAG